MNRLAHRLYTPSLTAAAVGTVTAALGVLQSHTDTWRVGMLILATAIPALCYCLAYRATQATDAQLADIHRDGYQLGLLHVHMGLLDQPSAPPDGGEGVEEEDTQGISVIRLADLPDNVRPIRGHGDEEDNTRKVV
ncbi:hypothetical protein [Streptomyces sp. NPDC017520]|uniref:hypothetical protein n=1 Tax=Streptomyces sp. NPDC017520 TaxID=3364998 RepID=UPI003796FFAF